MLQKLEAPLLIFRYYSCIDVFFKIQNTIKLIDKVQIRYKTQNLHKNKKHPVVKKWLTTGLFNGADKRT